MTFVESKGLRTYLIIYCQNAIQYSLMWPFRRKKVSREPQWSGPLCSHCRSTHTRVIVYHGTDQPDYVRTWRGQRYLTCRCFDCGQDFYIEEPLEGLADEVMMDNEIIDNEEELSAAEDELRRRVEDDEDRRCL